MTFTFKLTERRNSYGEFVVKCFRDGNRHPKGDYHTDDLEDARHTLKAMQEYELVRVQTNKG